MKNIPLLIFISLSAFSCTSAVSDATQTNLSIPSQEVMIKEPLITAFDSSYKTIHILVALCDNENQGIMPVPKKIGNGQDPFNNLYWGAGYGIKTYFKRSAEWTLTETRMVNSTILERVIFKHKSKNFYIVADAYDGRHIQQTTIDFMKSSAGMLKDTIQLQDKVLGINGNSKLLAYIGHDGLMEFDLVEKFVNQDGKKRDAIILACVSKSYFEPYLNKANINPLVWTTGLMAPEAYTIHDALSGYVLGETNEQIRLRAAQAYSKYQKCGLNAAKNLLVTR